MDFTCKAADSFTENDKFCVQHSKLNYISIRSSRLDGFLKCVAAIHDISCRYSFENEKKVEG